ncbi:MAG: 50S ribosomal protein L7ae [Methanosarcinales archaeon]|nr:50S ribosomal protein L7ae [Methanosarcinales archaeon]HDJ38609.1 50S ribosomal protein L7ae [Methanosarcinales archaeon]
MAQMYVTYDAPDELRDKALESLELARDTGKIKKGTNEVTKAIERGIAQLILIGEDVNPPEIVAHLPMLSDEKKIPYIYIKKQDELGAACGLGVGCAAVAIINSGKGKNAVEDIVGKIAALR